LKDKFLTGAKRALEETRKTLKEERFEMCIINAHMSCEYMMKISLEKMHSKVRFMGFKDLMGILKRQKLISASQYDELEKLRRLRNKVYHEAYIPSKKEAESAFKIARKILEKC